MGEILGRILGASKCDHSLWKFGQFLKTCSTAPPRRHATTRVVPYAMEAERESLIAGDVNEYSSTSSTRGDRDNTSPSLLGRGRFVRCLGHHGVLLAPVIASGLLVAAVLYSGVNVASLLTPSRLGESLTAREYGGDLITLAWNYADGFREPPCQDSNWGKFRCVRGHMFLEANIRKYFPSRLTADSPPFEVYFSVADMPHSPCLETNYRETRCHVDQWAPIFNFGSSLRDGSIFPSMRRATLLVLQECMQKALENRGFKVTNDTKATCNWLQYPDMSLRDANSGNLELAYNIGLFDKEAMLDKAAYEWDNLIPKAIWRGSDYPFLDGWAEGGSKPSSEPFLDSIPLAGDRVGAIKALLAGDAIGPRLRAVLLSQLHPDKWDAKFFNWQDSGDSKGGALGLFDTEARGDDTFGKYKYLLDLGGGGGTTGQGVLPRLSMPGVLFHHETKTLDSYFPILKPWKHYLPLDEDLGNFDELVHWVEQHPDKAKAISDAATEWVREFRKLPNLLRHNYEVLVKPLAQALDPTGVLQPIPFSVAHPGLPEEMPPILSGKKTMG